MNIAQAHLDALKSLGYSDSEARFLYIVATHAGYFTARQFMACAGAHWGKRTTAFWSKLERRRHARIERFPKSGVIHHLFSRQLYRQIEKENLRNRRAHEIEFIKRRIAILDFVIAHQEYEYLETEPAKVAYFCDKLGINERYLFARLYLSPKISRSSVRYFVDKFPMFLGSCSPVVTFTYVHEGAPGFSDFVQHLGNYLPLFRQLSEFRLIYVSRTAAHFVRAREIFESLVKIPLESDIAEDLLRYFRVRKMWDEKQYGSVSDSELIFRNEARGRFQGRTYEGLYQSWRQGQVSAAVIEAKFAKNDRRRAIHFETYQLQPIRISTAISRTPGADGKTCPLQARN